MPENRDLNSKKKLSCIKRNIVEKFITFISNLELVHISSLHIEQRG